MPGPGRGKKTDDNVSRFGYGNNADYLTARIARDFPDLLQAVRDGRMSVNRACIEAGISVEVMTVPVEPRAMARSSFR